MVESSSHCPELCTKSFQDSGHCAMSNLAIEAIQVVDQIEHYSRTIEGVGGFEFNTDGLWNGFMLTFGTSVRSLDAQDGSGMSSSMWIKQ